MISVSASGPSHAAALSIATDGVTDTNPFISLPVGLQWIEVDLQGSYNISQLQFFHYWGDQRTYHDVIARLSSDHVNFTTVFNNDNDGSAGFGSGNSLPRNRGAQSLAPSPSLLNPTEWNP